MEHTEIITSALRFTRDAFFSKHCLGRWFKLFIYAIAPVVIGYIIATILLQTLALPSLTNSLVNDNYGFTEHNLSEILQWIAGIIAVMCVFIIPLIQGYAYRIFKSGKMMPPTDNVLGLFFSGWRCNIVMFVYAIPLIIFSIIYMLLFIKVFPTVLNYTGVHAGLTVDDFFSGAALFIYIAVQFVTFIIVGLFALVALVHVARAGSLREALKIKKMAGIIKKIGWYDYILSLVIMSILFLLISFVFIFIGGSLEGVALLILVLVYAFIMIPVLTLFMKYMTEIYDTAFIHEEDDNVEFDDF